MHPACHIFPTEVSCKFTASSVSGHLNETNFLCILTNNLFNQLFFFILWIYWVFILLVSILGLVFRFMRFHSSAISKYFCLRKIKNPAHHRKISMILLKPSEWFVLEELLDDSSHIKSEKIANNLCLSYECELLTVNSLF